MEIKISDMVKAKEGDSGIEIEGEVSYAQAPKTMDFGDGEVIKQFIVIKDDTGEQGCNATLRSKEEIIKKGTNIKFKGTVSKEYTDKKGKLQRSLNGYKIDETVKVEEFRDEGEDVSQAKQTTKSVPVEKIVEKPEKDMDKVWEEKDLRIARECAIKAVTELVKTKVLSWDDSVYVIADKIVDYIYKGLGEITSADITKEFGGTAIEEKPDDEPENPEKEQKIAQAKELIRNPHLAEPVNDTMASIVQKRQIYGYMNEDGEQIKGIIHSQYLTKEEAEGVGEWQNLTKKRANLMWEKWYGEGKERDKRKKAKEKEGSPFVTKRNPIEKRDPKDTTSLTEDLLIEAIQIKRKELHLEDDVKFKKEIGYNTNFESWTEKELIKLNDLLKDWKPSWVTE